MNSATASDNCELTLECSSLEQEELQVLHVGTGGGGKLSSISFSGAEGIILDCHWNGLILECSVGLWEAGNLPAGICE